MTHTKKTIKDKLIAVCKDQDNIFGGKHIEITIKDMVDYLFQIQKLGGQILIDQIDYCEVVISLPFLSETTASYEDLYESFHIMKFIMTNESIPLPSSVEFIDSLLTLSWLE